MSFPGTYPDRRRPLPPDTPDTPPAVGRVVHVYLPGRPQPVTAGVREVMPGRAVLLMPFFPSQAPDFWAGLGAAPVPFSPTPKPGCWTWPALSRSNTRMTETPAEQPANERAEAIAQHPASGSVAMRPNFPKPTTAIVFAASTEDAAAAIRDPADELRDEAKDARDVADRLAGRLTEAEADNRMLHRRGIDMHLIADEVAECAERAAVTNVHETRYWLGSLVAIVLAAVAGALGWEVVRGILHLAALGLLGFMVGAAVQWNRGRGRLLRRLAALRRELSGPAL